MVQPPLFKILQRKLYDILSKKHTLFFLLISFILLLISAFHFGESVMEWSKEKYTAVFSPYQNNIVGKNLRSMLCQYVPIDVVYTWVNGSDPKFARELAKAKEDYGFSGSHLNCTFSHCVKSHMVIVRPAFPSSVTLGDLEEYDQQFENIEKIFVISSSQGIPENITVLSFFDIKIAQAVAERKLMPFDGQNYSLSAAYITDSWNSPNSVLLNNIFLMTNMPAGFSEAEIKRKFPDNIRKAIKRVFIYEERSLAVLSLSDASVLSLIKKMDNVTFNNKIASVVSAYLLVELSSDHEDISSSRFTDNEELRYSLRSLEKHAPWIQHVYIVTNGQIPYWLNLDNPRVSIVTHEEIFPNKSHLPTFSSPAIECHVHRIPNLSEKFLYLNDDVMFGKDVWPEDFYTHTKGQKVYLSWPVPNCAEGCPSSWIRDGYCDKPCNNSQCQWDGGDCTADNPLMPFHGPGLQQESVVTSFLNLRNKNFCNEDCANAWLADRYCDRACNIRNCGFDAGDCGTENFDKIAQLVLLPNQSTYSLPEGEYVGYFNLSVFQKSNYSITEGFYEENAVIRTIAISLKYSIIGIVLHPNHNSTNLTISLKGEHNNSIFEKVIYLFVSTNPKTTFEANIIKANKTVTKNETEETFTFEQFPENLKSPKVLSFPSNNSDYTAYGNVNVSASSFPQEIKKRVSDLRADFSSGLLTAAGFWKKKSMIIAAYLISLNNTEKLPVIIYEENPVYLTSENSVVKSMNSENSDQLKQVENKIVEPNIVSKKNKTEALSKHLGYPKITNPNVFYFGKNKEVFLKNLSKISQNDQALPKLPGLISDNLKQSKNRMVESNIVSRKVKLEVADKDVRYIGTKSPNVNNLGKVYAQSIPKVTNSLSSTFSPLNAYLKSLQSPLFKKVSNSSKSSISSPSVTQRHLLDTFGDSLRHVNKLYNEAFGYEARKVPSHIAHFVDKNVMSRLTERFSAAFDVTSSHKIRSSNDMQFAFSYYYFLMSEIQTLEIYEIFDIFDIDQSGTWSDREIRTVLTRLHDLPLDFSTVTEFEQHIINCSSSMSIPAVEASVPYNERYYDSKLPLVTKSLICSCPEIKNILLKHFGERKKNAFEVVGEDEVAFKMIHNNLSQVLGQIDDLRKNPRKFVCLNDNMNHGTQEAEVIRAVIQDFYESLFPTRSSFELPSEYRNRFLYVDELKDWRKARDIIRIVTYTVLATLIIFSLISFWRSEMQSAYNNRRSKNKVNRNRRYMQV